ncbi:GGDEF domain-containing protein [Sphingomonas sp. Leaf10]|uniref:GGDEF domain-containing protein n=1 Tax=Sphingomonas sp. Leaf10 TaxID=1735676 RepID=UPI000B1E5779|nr:GGDEF domain-containing protein [Sphingomonas sp. Leaf10]
MYLERLGSAAPAGNGLVRAILTFLEDQRLEPTPVNYTFAYRVMSDPAGHLAREVARRTDGGIRLSGGEVEELGNAIESAAPGRIVAAPVAPASTGPDPRAAETQRLVAGFESTVAAMHDETRDFGRDLAASADALRAVPCIDVAAAIADLARITATMRARVEIAESRLAQAKHEASGLREELAAAHQDARRDPLTELPNRRAFEAALADRAGGPFHVALCDVDHFKSVNDQHGHPVGDRVLKAIAATLTRECAGQLVARYGGEEFAVLLGGIDLASAGALLERARRAVGARRYRLRESDTVIEGITLSAGLVTLRSGETITEGIARADRLLYAAKRGGRNQMVGETR